MADRRLTAASQLLVGLIVTQQDETPYNGAAIPELFSQSSQLTCRRRRTPITVTSLEPFERAHKKVWKNLTSREKNELAGI